jgi:hypothetical protein
MTTEKQTGMTLHEADTLRNIVDAYFQDRTDRAGGRVVDKGITFRDLTAYMDSLLAVKDAENAALKAHQQVTQEILTLLPECLKYPEGAVEILQFMHEVKAFYEEKAAYVPQPRPEPVSREVKKTRVERPPMIIFDDE